jgi:hypothetical protein
MTEACELKGMKPTVIKYLEKFGHTYRLTTKWGLRGLSFLFSICSNGRL